MGSATGSGPSARCGNAPWLHASILSYLSDDTISDNLLVPYGLTWASPNTILVSVDHAMWFHRPPRVDQWLFVDQEPVTTAGSRGLTIGRVWAADGTLVATIAQEGLFRLPPGTDG